MNFDEIKKFEPVNPNEVCLKNVTPIIEVLKEKETEARKQGRKLMYFAYCEARHMLENSPKVGAEEFVRMQTGKTIRELAKELSLHEVLNLVDKLYYEYQIYKMEGNETR